MNKDQEELVKQINEERLLEQSIVDFRKSIDIIMGYTKEVYNSSISNGFNDDESFSFAFDYFSSNFKFKERGDKLDN